MNGSSTIKLKTQITWKSSSANKSRVLGQVIDDSTFKLGCPQMKRLQP